MEEVSGTTDCLTLERPAEIVFLTLGPYDHAVDEKEHTVEQWKELIYQEVLDYDLQLNGSQPQQNHTSQQPQQQQSPPQQPQQPKQPQQ